ncbi:transglutaminase-like domain-containing protein [Micropruina sp.]|uniref:transglutaminase-like domain-containing protein n=1 Tax=Micropruina sp. TaxID=2737536 RepID=UPI0039E71B28
MQRTVSAHIEATLSADTEVVLAIAVAHGPSCTESLEIIANGAPAVAREIAAPHGGRLHLVTGLPAGALTIDYNATVNGIAPVEQPADIDRISYVRPSRYCDSDKLMPVAAAEFAGLQGKNLLDAVSSWVGSQLSYVSGSSKPIDGAVDTYLLRQGVCRDYAHLVIALLRGLNVPARLAAVYAPGLDPMDFHAVAEAFVDGAWWVVDATALAPRPTLLRIATGRDAADTAFLSTIKGALTLHSVEVGATVDALPNDDLTLLTALR